MLFIISEIGTVQVVKKSFTQVLKWYAERLEDNRMAEQMFGFKMSLIYTVTVVNEKGIVVKEFQISNKAG